jgi:hypothetical protein
MQHIFQTVLPLAKFPSVILSLATCMMVQGCSYTYVDETGRINAVGIMHVTVPEKHAGIAGTFVDLTTLGVAITSGPDTSSLGVGYNRNILGSMNNDSVVMINKADTPIASHTNQNTSSTGEINE